MRLLTRHPRLVLAALVLALPAVALAQDALPIPSDGTVRAAFDWLDKPGQETVKIVFILVGGFLVGLWIWTRRPDRASAAPHVSEALAAFNAALTELGASLQSMITHLEQVVREQRETADGLHRLTAEVRDLAIRMQGAQPTVPIPAHVPCPHGVGAAE